MVNTLQPIESESIELSHSEQALALPEPQEVKDQFLAIKQFQSAVRSHLKEGLSNDYGTIPGTNKPTLLKPGAEKIMRLAKVACEYEIIDQITDLDKPFFSYTFKCKVLLGPGGPVIDEGVGECNSLEGKYANNNAFSVRNTILKMAKKRALVDAALAIGRLSDLFTQDLEDMRDVLSQRAPKPAPSKDIKFPYIDEKGAEVFGHCQEHGQLFKITVNQKNSGNPDRKPSHVIDFDKQLWCEMPDEAPPKATVIDQEVVEADKYEWVLDPLPPADFTVLLNSNQVTQEDVNRILGSTAKDWIKNNNSSTRECFIKIMEALDKD